MKLILSVLCAIALLHCSGTDAETKKQDAQSLRNRNLALAYIESGMMKEANEKLAVLASLLPDEAFVFANQGLVALRQNKLEKSKILLEKANSLAPNTPAIALLRGEVAMLNGEFEKSIQILEAAVLAKPTQYTPSLGAERFYRTS